ncbi:unnamed protein product [Allacma fusca]|uniref:Uncharacterized protein n=1 Tax=Allacma fusca TaxID=39272 RepID=A0A8J2KP33_9HEXA|nr:unnamed protein product [Allacma fusca]
MFYNYFQAKKAAEKTAKKTTEESEFELTDVETIQTQSRILRNQVQQQRVKLPKTFVTSPEAENDLARGCLGRNEIPPQNLPASILDTGNAIENIFQANYSLSDEEFHPVPLDSDGDLLLIPETSSFVELNSPNVAAYKPENSNQTTDRTDLLIQQF